MSDVFSSLKSKAVAWDLDKGTTKNIDKATSKFYFPMFLQIISNVLIQALEFSLIQIFQFPYIAEKLSYINLSTFSQETQKESKFL